MSDEIVNALTDEDSGIVGALRDIRAEFSNSWSTEDGNYETMWARVFVATLTGTASCMSSTPQELVDRAYAIANECHHRWFAEHQEDIKRRQEFLEAQRAKP